MSTIKTNSIQTVAGKTILQGTGSILQVVQYGYSSVYENTAQNTEYDMPGVLGDGTASINPINSSSRILFSAVMHCGQEDTWRGNFFKTFYKIGSGSWTQFNGGFAQINYVASTNGLMNSVTTEFLLSSLSTTSTVYFKITQIGHANGGYLHLNQNNTTNSGAANNTVSTTSTITLKEISA
jgi:hypothetical protein